MQSDEIRQRFLDFFENRGHAIIPSASLIPEGDASTLFTTAGMQPLVPYLLGSPHPKGKRLVNVQKCLRTGDIDEVGDSTHLTFFEMLGNWSLGDYWKKEAIAWKYEFITSKTEGLGIDPNRLYITCFAGTPDAPKDTESAHIWESVGVPKHRIYFLEDNWWSPGENGPCGPDTEVFYDLTEEGLGDLPHKEYLAADERQDVVEIGNVVLIEYEKKNGAVVGELEQKNIDYGGGLERQAVATQGVRSVFDTDLFTPLLDVLPKGDERARRIVADHIRAAVFLVADNVVPSNTDRGYVLRRLIRRAVRYNSRLGMESIVDIATAVVDVYSKNYSHILQNMRIVQDVIQREEAVFQKTLKRGLKEFEKGERDAFVLFTTYGFPLEMTQELAHERGESIDVLDFNKKMQEHHKRSRVGAGKKFKGGLAASDEETVKLHTAHHLLLAALQKVLGDEVKQRGSNITAERLRIDFSFERKLTDEEKKKVEDLVNEWIARDLEVVRKEMPREEAEQLGAEMEFGTKYPDIVSVYLIQDTEGNIISKEFCGGPHVERTGKLGTFEIQSEKASSAGVRRIKATLN